jgi:hypothetical protein
LIFRSLGGAANAIVRASADGSAPGQQLDTPIVHDKGGVSPDGQWVIVLSPGAAHEASATFAVPLQGGPVRRICEAYCFATWSPDGRFLYVPVGAGGVSQPNGTLVFPLTEGRSLPELPAEGIDRSLPGLPAEGINANAPIPELPGAQAINQGLVAPGSEPSRYVFTKVEFHRNLFRIPIR